MDDVITAVPPISDEFILACGKIKEVDVVTLMVLVVSCSIIRHSDYC